MDNLQYLLDTPHDFLRIRGASKYIGRTEPDFGSAALRPAGLFFAGLFLARLFLAGLFLACRLTAIAFDLERTMAFEGMMLSCA